MSRGGQSYRVLDGAVRDARNSWKPNKNAAAVAYNRERGLKAPTFDPNQRTSECEPTYTLDKHITPDVKARADAEWDAMDDFGRLPGETP